MPDIVIDEKCKMEQHDTTDHVILNVANWCEVADLSSNCRLLVQKVKMIDIEDLDYDTSMLKPEGQSKQYQSHVGGDSADA